MWTSSSYRVCELVNTITIEPSKNCEYTRDMFWKGRVRVILYENCDSIQLQRGTIETFFSEMIWHDLHETKTDRKGSRTDIFDKDAFNGSKLHHQNFHQPISVKHLYIYLHHHVFTVTTSRKLSSWKNL